jgi:hypothetical protein
MAVQNQDRLRPKTGETWAHYKGEECLILGILRNGNREQSEQLMVAYELVKKVYSSSLGSFHERDTRKRKAQAPPTDELRNIENQMLETTSGSSISRFYRSIEDFMSTVIDERGRRVYRFELITADISAELWEQSFALCET